MAFTIPLPLITNPSLPIVILLLPCVLALTLLTTYTFTSIRYYLSPPTTKPAKLPYTLPYLGHALSFLAPYPGRFFTSLRHTLPEDTRACTLLLAGQTMHLVWDGTAIQALFKNRHLDRNKSNVQVLENGLGMTSEQCQKFYPRRGKGEEEKFSQEGLYHAWLLEKGSVGELTRKFAEVLRDALGGVEVDGEVGLYAWLRPLMFRASTTAFMGTNVLRLYKEKTGGADLGQDFFDFDAEFLSMFFGIPSWIKPKGYKVRERLLRGLEPWEQQWLDAKKAGDKICGDGDQAGWWEERFGSRFLRERQHLYDDRGLSARGRACVDLGFLFGLNSNAIPCTGWMLFHVLTIEGLRGRIVEELETARTNDGGLDVNILVSLPLFNSVFNETLRMYVDILVSRELTEDLVLPFAHPGGKGSGQEPMVLSKNSLLVSPSWMGHRDPEVWSSPAFDVFFPERFLKHDLETGKDVFSTVGTGGKFFPFGGGKTICPGRVFAKQEVLAAVAMVLLEFDFETLGFLDYNGKPKNEFPSLKDAYSGAGVMAMNGDVKVRMSRRKKIKM